MRRWIKGKEMMPPLVITLCMLTLGNVFMTFAWRG